MWKVVSGVRSSCVTAETKSARRWPSRMTFASRAATAPAARSTHAQATGKIQRIGDGGSGPPAAGSPGTRRNGSEANMRAWSSADPGSTGRRSAWGNRSLTVSSSPDLIAGQSSRQPWK